MSKRRVSIEGESPASPTLSAPRLSVVPGLPASPRATTHRPSLAQQAANPFAGGRRSSRRPSELRQTSSAGRRSSVEKWKQFKGQRGTARRNPDVFEPLQEKASPGASPAAQGRRPKPQPSQAAPHEVARLHKILCKAPEQRGAGDLAKLRSSLRSVEFFKHLDGDVFMECCKVLRYTFVPREATIFEEGEEGSLFYVILGGKVGVYIKEKTADEAQEEKRRREHERQEKEESARREREQRAREEKAALQSMQTRLTVTQRVEREDFGSSEESEDEEAEDHGWSAEEGAASPFERSEESDAASGLSGLSEDEENLALTQQEAEWIGADSEAKQEKHGGEAAAKQLQAVIKARRIALLLAHRAAAHREGRGFRPVLKKDRKESKEKQESKEAPPAAGPRKGAKFQLVAVKEVGSAFGEVALNTDQPRSATCRAFEHCHFATLDRAHYQRILKSYYDRLAQDKIQLLRQVALFKGWDVRAIERVAALFHEKTYHRGERVVTAGAPVNELYIVCKGEFSVRNDELASCVTARVRADGAQLSGLFVAPQLFGFEQFVLRMQEHDRSVVCESLHGVVFAAVTSKVVSQLSMEHIDDLAAYARTACGFHEERERVLRTLLPPPKSSQGPPVAEQARALVRANYRPQQRIARMLAAFDHDEDEASLPLLTLPSLFGEGRSRATGRFILDLAARTWQMRQKPAAQGELASALWGVAHEDLRRPPVMLTDFGQVGAKDPGPSLLDVSRILAKSGAGLPARSCLAIYREQDQRDWKAEPPPPARARAPAGVFYKRPTQHEVYDRAKQAGLLHHLLTFRNTKVSVPPTPKSEDRAQKKRDFRSTGAFRGLGRTRTAEPATQQFDKLLPSVHSLSTMVSLFDMRSIDKSQILGPMTSLDESLWTEPSFEFPLTPEPVEPEVCEEPPPAPTPELREDAGALALLRCYFPLLETPPPMLRPEPPVPRPPAPKLPALPPPVPLAELCRPVPPRKPQRKLLGLGKCWPQALPALPPVVPAPPEPTVAIAQYKRSMSRTSRARAQAQRVDASRKRPALPPRSETQGTLESGDLRSARTSRSARSRSTQGATPECASPW